MIPKTMVEKNPPMKPSQVFLGDSCNSQYQRNHTPPYRAQQPLGDLLHASIIHDKHYIKNIKHLCICIPGLSSFKRSK